MSYFVGKAGNKKITPSRAYMHFVDFQTAFDFCKFFDGHVFVNGRGQEEKAHVEYAPYQRIPKPRRKTDTRAGTIEQEAEYQAFLESLKVPEVKLPSAEVQLDKKLRGEDQAPVQVSALLEELKARRAARFAQTGGYGPSNILQRRKASAAERLQEKRRLKIERDRERKRRRDERQLAKLQAAGAPIPAYLLERTGNAAAAATAAVNATAANATPGTASTTNAGGLAPGSSTPGPAGMVVGPDGVSSVPPGQKGDPALDKKKKEPNTRKNNRDERRKKKGEDRAGVPAGNAPVGSPFAPAPAPSAAAVAALGQPPSPSVGGPRAQQGRGRGRGQWDGKTLEPGSISIQQRQAAPSPTPAEATSLSVPPAPVAPSPPAEVASPAGGGRGSRHQRGGGRQPRGGQSPGPGAIPAAPEPATTISSKPILASASQAAVFTPSSAPFVPAATLSATPATAPAPSPSAASSPAHGKGKRYDGTGYNSYSAPTYGTYQPGYQQPYNSYGTVYYPTPSASTTTAPGTQAQAQAAPTPTPPSYTPSHSKPPAKYQNFLE
eukprot:TRINITY_DN6833_c0_g1_i5.p1 TRINITY_DN6833_c0_g1~~TRINITY_DN6833_c0_g1_i5.p1  ORF type:complete len:613 (+),score=138.08 TRINITY_DN6833_c0_g1_i5:191-1840(+)